MFKDINLNKVDSIEYVRRLIGDSWKVNIKMLDGTTHERYADCTGNIAIDWKLKFNQESHAQLEQGFDLKDNGINYYV